MKNRTIPLKKGNTTFILKNLQKMNADDWAHQFENQAVMKNYFLTSIFF